MRNARTPAVELLACLACAVLCLHFHAGVDRWTLPGEPLFGGYIRELASGERTLYAGSWGDGVFASVDDGDSWEAAGLRGELVLSLAVSPTDDRAVYAGTVSGIFRSHDGGASWLLLTRGITQVIVVDPTNVERLYVAIDDRGLIRSEDGGDRW